MSLIILDLKFTSLIKKSNWAKLSSSLWIILWAWVWLLFSVFVWAWTFNIRKKFNSFIALPERLKKASFYLFVFSRICMCVTDSLKRTLSRPSLKRTYIRLCIHTYSLEPLSSGLTWSTVLGHLFVVLGILFLNWHYDCMVTLFEHALMIIRTSHQNLVFNALLIFHYTAIKVGLLILQPRCMYTHQVQSHRANHTLCFLWYFFVRYLRYQNQTSKKNRCSAVEFCSEALTVTKIYGVKSYSFYQHHCQFHSNLFSKSWLWPKKPVVYQYFNL